MARPDSWFRLYNTAVDNPKVQRLPDALFKAWVNLLCVASKHGGLLPAPADIAFALRVKQSVAEGWLKTLEARGLLDRDDAGTLAPHDWNAHQYKSDISTERVRRFRQRQADDGATVSETPPEQTQIQTQTSEQSKPDTAEQKDPPRARDEDFEKFWDAYPEKIGRKAAEAAWTAARDRPDIAAVVEAVLRYAHAKPADRAWCSPARWLREGRWSDAPGARGRPGAEPLLAGGRTATQWRMGVKFYLRKKYWPPSFGPEPGYAGCECPRAILAEFGFGPPPPAAQPRPPA